MPHRTITLSEDVLEKLDELRYWSKSKSRGIVVQDAVETIYGLIVARAKTAPRLDLQNVRAKLLTIEKQPESEVDFQAAKELIVNMLDLVDIQLDKYWKGRVKTLT